jgi:C-terminal processing protease CtpA/Prc
MRILLTTSLLLIVSLALGQRPVTFSLSGAPDSETYTIGIRGSEPPLSWEKTYFLTKEADRLVGELTFDSALTFFEYKYVLETEKGGLTYELDGQENRLGIFKRGRLDLVDTWDVMSSYDLQALPLLPAAKLQEDVKILGEALWSLHPGVERYHDSTSYFSQLQALSQSLSEPTSYATAYREISRFVATLKCGHTYANPFNQTGFIQNIILNQADKLPFGLEWFESRLFITKNATKNPLLARGTEIAAINGLPTQTLAKQLLALTKGDGANDAKRFKDLNVIGYDSYEMFDVYFPLLVRPEEGSFSLSVIDKEGQEKQVRVKATTRQTRNQILQAAYPEIPRTIEDTWQFQFLEEKLGYLKLGTFVIWDFQTDWKKFLKNAFRELEKAKAEKLIIDLRGNEGGADEVLEVLQPYLMKGPCTVQNFEERMRYASVPASLKPYVFTWDKSIYDFRDKVKRNPDGSYRFATDNPPTTTYPGSRKAFEGEIYFLMDASNSSATFYLAKWVKECGIGTLAGETTGGSQKGINGGNLFFLRLPHSRVEVDIPVFGQFNDQAPKGGIAPDLPLPRTREDVMQGVDGQLNRLLTHIRKN